MKYNEIYDKYANILNEIDEKLENMIKLIVKKEHCSRNEAMQLIIDIENGNKIPVEYFDTWCIIKLFKEIDQIISDISYQNHCSTQKSNDIICKIIDEYNEINS